MIRGSEREEHLTRRKLIDSVLELYAAAGGKVPSSAAVLQHSKVAKGSLYHHFEDFDDLVQVALLERYEQLVDVALARLSALLLSADRGPGTARRLRTFSRLMFSPDVGALRGLYAQVVVLSTTAKRADRMNQTQLGVHHRLAESLQVAQDSGLLPESLDPSGLAVQLQALLFGPPVMEASDASADEQRRSGETSTLRWADMVDRAITNMFLLRDE